MSELKLAVLDVKPGAAMESQSGLAMLRPRVYGAYMESAGPKRVAAIVMLGRLTPKGAAAEPVGVEVGES